jgi:transposase
MQHRTRDVLIRQRTQIINALRAHLAELGLVAAMRSRLFRVTDIGRCLAYRMVKGTSITSNGEIA